MEAGVVHGQAAVPIDALSCCAADELMSWAQRPEARASGASAAREHLRRAKSRRMTEPESQQFRAFDKAADASAFLWRLDLLGVDVGVKWDFVADRWETASPMDDFAADAWLAMMAFVGARRELSQRQTLITLKVTSLGWGRAAYVAKTSGMAAAQAILAFGAGRYAETMDLLRPLRDGAPPFGWSQVHLDLADQTLIEAAIRSGQDALASELVGERAGRRPSRMAARVIGSQFLAGHA